jgi:septal ring factor EnvC (AmiA/AmiB activator)
MKKWLLLLPMVALLLVLGCFWEPEVNQERQEFQLEIDSQIDRMEQRIAEARDRAEGLPDDATSRLNQSIDDLEAQKLALENKLDEMKSASGDEWESFKADVERASHNVESAFNNLQAAFEEALSEV